jgi:hypothetical protein
MRKLPGARIKPVKTTPIGANPEIACLVSIDGPNTVMARTAGIVRIMPVMSEGVCFTIQPIKSGSRTNPEYACLILMYGEHLIATQAMGIAGVVPVSGELLRAGVKLVEATSPAADPDVAFSVPC